MHRCDHSECPAFALHHIDLFGQDFHFCNHHWVELAPALSPHLPTWMPDVDQVPADPTAGRPAASPTLSART